MSGIDFTHTQLESIITHHIGNKMKEGELLLSEETTSIDEVDTMSLLNAYFLSKFKAFDFQQFHHSMDLELNELFSMVRSIFKDPDQLVPISQSMARLLFDTSDHPAIKEGEMNVVYFKEVNLDGEEMDAIGIFKSETVVPFIQMIENQKLYAIQHDFGFQLDGLDKACLIFNCQAETGYKLLAFDRTNGNNEAQFWMEKFLKTSPVDDDYNNTKSFLQATKHFVTENLADDHRVSKTEQLDLLDRTMDYFKTKDSFEKKEFAEAVLQSPEIIESFEAWDQSFSNDSKYNNSFDISEQAVKKQTGIYKSVLKLDKNFTLYIHGNRKQIERGVDEEGRKYYKIFYDEEK